MRRRLQPHPVSRPTAVLAAATLLLGGVTTALTPAPAGAGEHTAPAVIGREAYEVHYVDTVGDAVIRVEVWRDTSFDPAKQPVLLTYSPYNSTSWSTSRTSPGPTGTSR